MKWGIAITEHVLTYMRGKMPVVFTSLGIAAHTYIHVPISQITIKFTHAVSAYIHECSSK